MRALCGVWFATLRQRQKGRHRAQGGRDQRVEVHQIGQGEKPVSINIVMGKRV